VAFAVVHSQDSPAKTPNYAKNGKNNMKEFIALHNRTVSRDEIQTVIALAKEQNNTEVIYRLSKILNDHPDSNRFNINIINYPQETTQQVALAGARHSGDYREALDECGRLKKGWHFVDGKVVKVQKRSGLLSQYTEKEFGHPFTKTLKAKFKELNWKYDRKNKRYYTPVPENEAEKEQQAQMFAFIEQEKATLEVNKPEKSPKTPTDKSAPSDLSSKIYTAETFAKDLDFNTIKRSYSWISFAPDARAERDIKQWGEIFYSLYNSLSEEAKKQGVLEAYNTAFDNGYTALLKLEKEIIATRSKTFSTAITGGAGITEKQVSTNEKRMRQQSEKSELWNQKYDKLHKLLEKIAKNKPADLYEEGDVIKSTDNNATTKLQQKLKMLQDRKTMLKNGVVAAKEYQKNKDLSVFKKYNIDKETTDTIVNHIDNGGKPTEKEMYNWFTMPYLNRDIKEVEKRIAILEKNQSQGEKETLIEGGKIVYNGEAQRLQIFFDGVPSKEVREALKAHAFKWAPTAKAWQRTLTENAKYAVNTLIKNGTLKSRSALAGTQHSGDYREALDDCGRLRKGWHFVDGKVVKTQPKNTPKTPTDKSAPSDSSSNKNIFLEEYRQLKAKYPEHLIIVSMEDHQNYCMYGKDAVIAADILNLQLLKLKRNDEFSISVGFKYKNLREYLEKLVKAGYKVAVRGNDLDKPQSSPQKNKTTKPSNPTKTPIAPTDPMSNELLYFNSVPQRQLVTRIKAKSMKLDFEDEYYNNIADKDGYFKPDFQNKSNLKIITDNCDNFVGTINTYDYPIISAPKPKTTGIMSLKKIVSKDNLRPIMTGVYIDKNHYIATDAHKIVFIPRPKNDEYRTGTIFDINFKCKKLGGCKTEEALIDGHFPIEIINKMKSEENSYISPPLNIENVISHLYCGEKAINIFTTYEKYKVITLYFEKERKTNYINIKHLLDTLEVLRSNGAKTFTLGFLDLEGKRQINIDTDNKLKAIIMPNYYQVNENPTSENCIMIAPINLILYKQFRPKKGLSVPTDGTLFGTLPTFKTRKEAKKYFKAWAAENLTGKKVYHKELDKYVVFSSRGIDHVLSSNISFNKMRLILQAEEMLRNSHLIAFEEDYKKRENIKGVYRMRSNAVLEGEDIKVILTLREGENGVIYYDHKIEEIKESTTPPRKSLANPFCGDSAPTNTPAKTVPNSTLSAPRHAGILKEALTEKGKLKKGWYFQDYGIIDPKGKYHPLERDYSLEYNLIEKELRDRAFQQDEKRKIKGFEENKKLEEAIKIFLKELSKENKKHFKNSKAMEVFYWAFPFTLERNSTFYTFEESNPYINKNLQELDKYFSDDNELFERLENYETLRRYRLKSLGLHISAKISSFIDKQGKVIRGDSNKLNQKYGLSAPEVFVEHSSTPSESPAPSITPRNNSLANKMATLQNRTFENFIIAEPQMQAFLGDVERKNTGSTAITITGGAGSGKTRFAFQFINALAQNYKVGHASLEEQPDSKLYFDKVQQYLDQTAQANVEAPEIENMQDLQALIERNDVIVIDSFTKIREWDRNFLLDRDLRKKYNGKLFLIIFQQTVAGNMRGGTTSEFDGDIILYTQVFPDYRENYIYPSKNRYNSTPSEQLRYSVYHQQLLPSESTPSDSSPVTSNTYEVIY
jgi:hypothetical protein